MNAAFGPGPLRTPVLLEAPIRVEDGGGGAPTAFTPVVTVWARIEHRRASESEDADNLSTEISVEMRIRWRADVRSGWRVRFEGRQARIIAALDRDQSRRWLDLICGEERR